MAWRKQDWSPRRNETLPKIGDRVIVMREIDRYPHFLVPKGAKGTIIEYDPSEIIRVRLDKRLRGAEEWDNEVHWTENADLIEEFHLDVAPIVAGRS